MTNKELLQDALNILEPIPADKWLTYNYYNSKKPGCGCALGLYAMSKNIELDSSIINWRTMDLRSASAKAYAILHPESFYVADIANINNRPQYNGYTELEIKDRVIHFLKDAVAIEEDF